MSCNIGSNTHTSIHRPTKEEEREEGKHEDGEDEEGEYEELGDKGGKDEEMPLQNRVFFPFIHRDFVCFVKRIHWADSSFLNVKTITIVLSMREHYLSSALIISN